MNDITIVGVTGSKGAGKGTVASQYIKHGYIELSFAKGVKKAVSEMFLWPYEMLLGDTDESRQFREIVDDWWSKKLGRIITPRIVLQEFSTDIMRNTFHRDIWLLIVEREIYEHVKRGNYKFVISDLRFFNEHFWIRKFLNNKIIRVIRPSIQTDDSHESEASWSTMDCDIELINDSSIEDLCVKVDSML